MPPLLWVFCVSIYHLATPALGATAQDVAIYKDVKFSDHAPVTVDYGFSL
jgi:exodeoxyribonuclease-3